MTTSKPCPEHMASTLEDLMASSRPASPSDGICQDLRMRLGESFEAYTVPYSVRSVQFLGKSIRIAIISKYDEHDDMQYSGQ
jgi:hypothetical protein